MLDTRGGGFTSVRADFAGGLKSDALRVRFRGDGKTYKVLLSNGQGGGPWSNNPSWQHDLPTKLGEEQSVVLPLAKFVPSFGGSEREDVLAGSPTIKDIAQVGLDALLRLEAERPTRKNLRAGVRPLLAFITPLVSRRGDRRDILRPIQHGLGQSSRKGPLTTGITPAS